MRKNQEYPSQRQFGFTLIEMVVVLGLVAIMSIIITGMYIGQNRLYRSQTQELTVLNHARTALDDVGEAVRSATRVISTHDIYTTGAQTLILQVQSVNASNQLIPGTFDIHVFYLDNGRLVSQIYPDPASTRSATPRQLAADVASLEFTYNDADLSAVTEVATQITVTSQGVAQNRSINVSAQHKLRNY